MFWIFLVYFYVYQDLQQDAEKFSSEKNDTRRQDRLQKERIKVSPLINSIELFSSMCTIFILSK